jgi:prevent-host-death family protein
MKKVSMYVLKRDLASVISEAEAGTEILVTKHNVPVARLTAPGMQHLRVGERFGKANLKPAIAGRASGRYMQILMEDRRAGHE